MRKQPTLVALCLMLAPLVHKAGAETLAEAAAREAARRAQCAAKKAPAYSDGELGRPASGGTFNPMTGPAEPAAPRQGSSRSSLMLRLPIPSLGEESESEGPVLKGGRTEDTWRSTATALQQEIRALTAQVKELEKNPGGMAERTLVCDNGNPQCWHPGAASASPGQRLARARARLQQAQQLLSDLEDEARRLSVPPGWLRER